MPSKILVIDDDPVQRRLLSGMLGKFDRECVCVESGEAGLELLGQGNHQFALIILDLIMPDMDGFEVLEQLRERAINIPTIVQTASGGIETVVRAMRGGAIDFVVKPVSPERLKVSIENALSISAMREEVSRVRKKKAGSLSFQDMICNSPRMKQVIALGKKAAASDIPVLIEGESGVGKELIARAIQGTSVRSGKNFVTVNCGALPENLIESILFGHEKGAFTGATEKHIGKFCEADKGTLFLDEVGELPPQVQVKLLRALQEGEVDPVGARKPVKSNFRLISATNRSLQEETAAGKFREDLYYRLSVFPIWIPPLRERREDIADLARHFLARFTMEEGRTNIRAISKDAMQMLEAHNWPGNIRQLENAIFRAVVLCESDCLQIDDFPQLMVNQIAGKPTNEDAALHEVKAPLLNTTVGEISVGLEETINDRRSLLTDEDGDILELEAVEGEVIRFAIELYGHNMSQVAKRLGIGRSTLYRRLKELGIEVNPTQPVSKQASGEH